MDKFQAYQHALRFEVRNIKHLTQAICSLGLFPSIDPAKTYNIYSKHQYPPGTFKGTFHDPYELAYLLWSLKFEFQAHNLRSFLYIGTGTGYAFYAILEFLRHFVNPHVTAKTIDPNLTLDAFDPAINLYIAQHFQQQSSDALASNNEGYDLVFIDGDHDYAAVKRDYENTRRKATLVVAHHFASHEFPDVRKFYGQFYKTHHTREITVASPGKFGYGLIYTNR